MEATQALTLIQDYLEQQREFEIVPNQQVRGTIVPLYARRTKKGQEFLFIHNANDLSSDLTVLENLHEEARKYANSFYKLPKAFRFKIPNIITIFVKSGGVTEEMQRWAQSKTHSMTGGEFHAVFFIDTESPAVYGQGISTTPVRFGRSDIRVRLEFKTIDPQNRGHYLVSNICEALFDEASES